MSTDPADLSNLKDLALPPAVSWWPPAPGWWIMAAALLIAIIFLAVSWRLRYRANAYRRAADESLGALAKSASEPGTDKSMLATEISELLKRTALAAFPRSDVASLSGQDWLAFLDRTGRQVHFTSKPANSLPLLCLGAGGGPDTIPAVIANARQWIRTHRALTPGAR